MKVHACQHLWLLVTLGVASSCTLDSRPSLGWDKHSELNHRDADVRDADFEADADAAMETGDASDVADDNASDVSANPVSCPTGQYVGQFECRVSAGPVSAQFELAFALAQSSPDSPEATGSGQILFSASGALMIADFAGRLDCNTGVFHADIANGFAVLVPIPVGVPFVGTLDGEIDEDAGVLAGDWRFELPPGTPLGTHGTCEGAWRAPLPR